MILKRILSDNFQKKNYMKYKKNIKEKIKIFGWKFCEIYILENKIEIKLSKKPKTTHE